MLIKCSQCGALTNSPKICTKCKVVVCPDCYSVVFSRCFDCVTNEYSIKYREKIDKYEKKEETIQ